MIKVNVKPSDLSEKNVFEEIFELIERHRLRYETEFQLGNLYDMVTAFDKSFEKFHTNDIISAQIKDSFQKTLNHTIGNFLVVIKPTGFKDEPFYYTFKRFIAFFTIVLEEANHGNLDIDLNKTFYKNFPSLKTNFQLYIEQSYSLAIKEETMGTNVNLDEDIDFEDELTEEEYFLYDFKLQIIEELSISKAVLIYKNDFTIKRFSWRESLHCYEKISEEYYMTVRIVIRSAELSASKLFTPLWLIVAGLEKIDNVIVEMEAIEKGSLITAFSIWMKDLLAKEETKAVLDTAKEAIVKLGTKGKVSYLDVKKSRKDLKKIDLENKKIEMAIEREPSTAEVQVERALSIEKKILENEKLKIENTKEKIMLIKQVSDLVVQGIIEADSIRIDINDILYILKEKDRKIITGPSISEITEPDTAA